MKKIGRYEIVEEVGRGAMGIVYKASDPTIGRMVAIKVLSLDSSSEEGGTNARESFMREARAAGRLSHPGIVTIHDALEDPETKSSYIVMEFIQGRTLEKILVDGPPISTEQALIIIHQIAEALEYAHKQQLIHRDLKPANILVTDDGRAKITDFGIARVLARDGSHRTTSVMGTPSYMSPEQLTGGELDARSDLFALGVLTYLMLSGEKPFAGETAAVLFKIVYEDPVPPSHVKARLSRGHDYLALRSLVKNRNRRYQNAREFLDDLDDVQHGKPPRSEANYPLSEIRAGERTLVTKTPFLPPKDHDFQPAPQKKSALEIAGMAVAAALGIAVLGTGVMLYRSLHRASTPPAAVHTVPALPTAQGNPGTSAPAGTSAPPVTPTPNSKAGETAAKTPKKEGANKASALMSETVRKSAKDSGMAPAAPGKAEEKKLASGTAQTASATPSPAKPAVPQPASSPPATPQPAKSGANAATRSVQVSCKIEVKAAVLTVSNDASVLLKQDLKGIKKGGLLSHIKGGYSGNYSYPINIPPGTLILKIRVQIPDNAVDKTKETVVPSDAKGAATLHVTIKDDDFSLDWLSPSHH